MYISSFQVNNYKSIVETPSIELSSGFNLIVGENNVGKTALAEALSLHFENKPHESQATRPVPGAVLEDTTSSVRVTFRLDHDELADLIKHHITSFFVPFYPEMDEQGSINRFFHSIAHGCHITCSVAKKSIISAHFDEYGHVDSGRAVKFIWDRSGTSPVAQGAVSGGEIKKVAGALAEVLWNRIYCFRAERFHVGQCAFGVRTGLQPDASNLPEVLLNLQSDPIKFNRFNEAVQQILPQVKWLSVNTMPESPGSIKIMVWSVDRNSQRMDLAMHLNECGTGIGQIAAILYVVLTATSSQVIVIDEPNSFLHPGAVLKLFDVLKRYPQHQYLVTTHSPTVATAVEPGSITILTKPAEDTKIESVKVTEARELKRALRDVGTKLFDVFGLGWILWVEGATEEECFPLIIDELVKPERLGVKVIGVLSADEFRRKDKKRVREIYRRLTESGSLLPKAIAFIFDREDLTEQDVDELSDDREQRIYFLQRRMFDNYLLDPDAISAVVSEIRELVDLPEPNQNVHQWLADHKWDKEYFSRVVPETDRTEALWKRTVRGDKLLGDMFNSLFEAKLTYGKTLYAPMLTNWIIHNNASELGEIVDLLKSVLDSAPRTTNER